MGEMDKEIQINKKQNKQTTTTTKKNPPGSVTTEFQS
jgi:hypothetical protein